mmetsp:Transcript_29741/g.75711  ORF Transcript_29741/g.75711 Transcript_29741/m.75711 type:complete len:81 (+) Transcript_29741:552-794(+)
MHQVVDEQHLQVDIFPTHDNEVRFWAWDICTSSNKIRSQLTVFKALHYHRRGGKNDLRDNHPSCLLHEVGTEGFHVPGLL